MFLRPRRSSSLLLALRPTPKVGTSRHHISPGHDLNIINSCAVTTAPPSLFATTFSSSFSTFPSARSRVDTDAWANFTKANPRAVPLLEHAKGTAIIGDERPQGSLGSFDVCDPATGNVIGNAALCSQEQGADAIDAAAAAQPGWATVDATARAKILRKIAGKRERERDRDRNAGL